jgi:hypothetical protein
VISRTLSLKAVLLWIIALFVAGCTFQSTQYEFVKNLVSKNKDSRPNKNWLVEWDGYQRTVYAVNGSNFILFGDEFGAQLMFQGAQVTYMKGLFPKAPDKEISVTASSDMSGVSLEYEITSDMVKEYHRCSFWSPSKSNALQEPNRSLWLQICTHLNSTYQNKRWLNNKGELVRAEYFLKRDYPPVKVSIL